jgi:hypothetical protein
MKLKALVEQAIEGGWKPKSSTGIISVKGINSYSDKCDFVVSFVEDDKNSIQLLFYEICFSCLILNGDFMKALCGEEKTCTSEIFIQGYCCVGGGQKCLRCPHWIPAYVYHSQKAASLALTGSVEQA